MEIIKDLNSDRLERKLDNGLIEVKEFDVDFGYLYKHYFINENDKLHGEFKRYDGNGQLWEQYFYKNGLKHGEYKWYYDNGQLREHSFFENGEANGVCTIFDLQGEIVREITYKDGEKIKDSNRCII